MEFSAALSGKEITLLLYGSAIVLGLQLAVQKLHWKYKYDYSWAAPQGHLLASPSYSPTCTGSKETKSDHEHIIKEMSRMFMSFVRMDDAALQGVVGHHDRGRELMLLLGCENGYLVVFTHIAVGVFTCKANIEKNFYLAALESGQWKESVRVWDTTTLHFCDRTSCKNQRGVTLLVCNHPCHLNIQKAYPRTLAVEFHDENDSIIFFQC